MAYFVGRVQTVSSYFILEAVMPRRENCVSACMNQSHRLADQNGGNRVATAAKVAGGFCNNMSVTVQVVSHKKNLVDGVNLVWVINCSFYMKNY